MKKKSTAPDQMAGKKRKDRNIDLDEMGDKIGKLHMAKQDLSKLQSRKMKGLKKSRDEVVGEAVDEEDLDEAVDIGAKRLRT